MSLGSLGCELPGCHYAQPRCSEQESVLREVAGHWVACHFALELRGPTA